MTPRGKRAGIEWTGGIVSFPGYVTGEGTPYRPEMLIWIGGDGAIIGSVVDRPGQLLGQAGGSLREAAERPMCGRPHAPDRVRVASRELADALRAAHPGLDVACAPTPEVDAALASLREMVGERAEDEPSYLALDAGPEAVSAFFRAAAGLFRAAPWKVVPDDQSLFSVTIDELGVHDAAMSVIGQLGESLGLIVFSSLGEFEAYLDAAAAIERGEKPRLPRHFVLNFEHADDVDAAARQEIARHGWEVATPDAYPWLAAIDSDLVTRPPTAAEVTFAEAIALALPAVTADKDELRAACHGGPPVERAVRVTTHAGPMEVVLRLPFVRTSPTRRKAARKRPGPTPRRT